jgi:hypothetical protein
MDSQLSFCFHLAHIFFRPLLSHAFHLLPDLRPAPTHHGRRASAFTVQVVRLLRELATADGVQAPGFEHRLKHGVVPLANLAPEDFVFFSAYALAGLMPPVSSFFLILLEFYGLQL